MKIRLSIIICVFNTDKELLAKCLESITNSTLMEIKSDYETLIVDDGSYGDYSDIAKRYGARLLKTKKREAFRLAFFL